MRINGAMQKPAGAPDEWVCNARAVHRDVIVKGHVGDTVRTKDLDACYCARCLTEIDSRLVQGSPQPTESLSTEQLESRGVVGLYTRKPDFYIPCGECHEGVPVSDPNHVSAARSGKARVLHFGCLPEEHKKAMLVAPYVLIEVGEEGDGDETGSEGVRGEDGDGTEEERSSGDLEGGGPEDDDSEAVG